MRGVNDDDPFAPALMCEAGQCVTPVPVDDAWTQLTVHAPSDVVAATLRFLQEHFGYRDIAPIDWCVLERREDFSQVDWAPAPVAVNQYSCDWRMGEGRGDIAVHIEGEKP